jgi:hypothetical protein
VHELIRDYFYLTGRIAGACIYAFALDPASRAEAAA